MSVEENTTNDTMANPVTEQTTEQQKTTDIAIPNQDYSEHSATDLIKDFRTLIKDYPIYLIKEEVFKIRESIQKLFDNEAKKLKEDFISEGGDELDFHYISPLKKEFNNLYFQYKEEKNQYYEKIKKDLQANLKERESIIEELKELVNDNNKAYHQAYDKFKEIKENWVNAGNIPSEHKDNIWKTYNHYCDEFYKFLHLNREFRALDFKYNLTKKLKLIDRAQELTLHKNPISASKEIHSLHRIWKEETGPVDQQYSQSVWNKFLELTQQIQDRKNDYLKKQEVIQKENLQIKRGLIDQISQIILEKPSSHKECQTQVEKVEKLKETFLNTGKVPPSENQRIWEEFKEVRKNFNHNRNEFYKNQKKKYQENCNQKLALVELAEKLEKVDDSEIIKNTNTIKKIQSDWKTIGHIPRKESQALWERFQKACNNFFARVHQQNKGIRKAEEEISLQKEALLKEVTAFELSGNHQNDLDNIKKYIEQWKKIGRTPQRKRSLERKFNNTLDHLFGQLTSNRKDGELLHYNHHLENLLNSSDKEFQLKKEKQFLQKRIQEVKTDIIQQENNLSFFKNASQNNPLLNEAQKGIQRNKEKLESWNKKLQALKKHL